MIVLDELTKRYGNRTILNHINGEIRAGEFVSIIGDSGAGKTTILKLILGIEQPTEGSVLVNNVPVHSMSSHELQKYRRTIGCIFQDYKLLQEKTVYDNVAFALEACDYGLAAILDRVPQILQRAGVHHLQHHYPHELSGGESQRVALARAIVHGPRLILADEPTGNLDEENARIVLKELVKLNMEGITVILTTHNRPLTELVGQRILTLKGGILS